MAIEIRKGGRYHFSYEIEPQVGVLNALYAMEKQYGYKHSLILTNELGGPWTQDPSKKDIGYGKYILALVKIEYGE